MDLLQWSLNFLINKSSGSGIKNENIFNKKLAEELCKPINRKFNKRKVHSPFIGNIWGANLADMELISKFNKVVKFNNFHYVLLMLIVNMHGLFLKKIKKELQLLMLLKKS